MNPKQRREIKDWYADLALGRTIKAEDVERSAAELARREQAQAPQPENLHQYKSALANMEQTINDLHRKNDINNALMTEGAQKIGELRIENARLRSLLAELTEAAKQHITCMNLNLPNRGLTQKEWASREELRAAIAKAKGGAL